MICDQCGFEHNSKGTCPKCGARVVYVNEDYERRRQAYLEAQKKAANGEAPEQELRRTSSGVVVPPGVHYSTEDEHNMKKGRDRAPSRYEEENGQNGKSETVAKFFEHILLLLASGIVWSRKYTQKIKKRLQKKRGKNNPVITKLTFEDERDLKFDDGKETLDTSKLVLAHKVFADKRIPILAGVCGGAALLIGLIVFLIIWNHTDHARMLLYVENTSSAVICDMNNRDKIIWSGELYSQIAYTNDGSVVVGYNNTSIQAEVNGNRVLDYKLGEGEVCNQIMVSEKGDYFAVLSCISEKTEAAGSGNSSAADDQGSQEAESTNHTYILYVGNREGGFDRVTSDEYNRSLLAITTDGRVIYEKMKTAAYGIVNQKTLEEYLILTRKAYTIAQEYSDYRLDVAKQCAYFVRDEKLYCSDFANPLQTFMDDGVIGLATDALQSYDGVLYRKSTGYYRMRKGEDEGQLILNSKLDDLIFYYYRDADVLCLTYHTGSEGLLFTLENISSVKPVLKNDEETLNNAYHVTQVLSMTNSDSLVYATESGVYIMTLSKKGVERLGLDMSSMGLQAAVSSKGVYAILGRNHVLYRFDRKGMALEASEATDLWQMD